MILWLEEKRKKSDEHYKNAKSQQQVRALEKELEETVPHIEKLEDEIHELESTVVQLKRDLKKDTSTAYDHMKTNLSNSKDLAKEAARKQWAQMRLKGEEQIQATEEGIRKSPLRSVGYAFLGGLVTSLLIGSGMRRK